MKKNKYFQPLFKPLVKTRKIESIVPVKKEPLKDQIEKYDLMPDNYDGETHEDISSSIETSIED